MSSVLGGQSWSEMQSFQRNDLEADTPRPRLLLLDGCFCACWLSGGCVNVSSPEQIGGERAAPLAQTAVPSPERDRTVEESWPRCPCGGSGPLCSRRCPALPPSEKTTAASAHSRVTRLQTHVARREKPSRRPGPGRLPTKPSLWGGFAASIWKGDPRSGRRSGHLLRAPFSPQPALSFPEFSNTECAVTSAGHIHNNKELPAGSCISLGCSSKLKNV